MKWLSKLSSLSDVIKNFDNFASLGTNTMAKSDNAAKKLAQDSEEFISNLKNFDELDNLDDIAGQVDSFRKLDDTFKQLPEVTDVAELASQRKEIISFVVQRSKQSGHLGKLLESSAMRKMISTTDDVADETVKSIMSTLESVSKNAGDSDDVIVEVTGTAGKRTPFGNKLDNVVIEMVPQGGNWIKRFQNNKKFWAIALGTLAAGVAFGTIKAEQAIEAANHNKRQRSLRNSCKTYCYGERVEESNKFKLSTKCSIENQKFLTDEEPCCLPFQKKDGTEVEGYVGEECAYTEPSEDNRDKYKDKKKRPLGYYFKKTEGEELTDREQNMCNTFCDTTCDAKYPLKGIKDTGVEKIVKAAGDVAVAGAETIGKAAKCTSDGGLTKLLTCTIGGSLPSSYAVLKYYWESSESYNDENNVDFKKEKDFDKDPRSVGYTDFVFGICLLVPTLLAALIAALVSGRSPEIAGVVAICVIGAAYYFTSRMFIEIAERHGVAKDIEVSSQMSTEQKKYIFGTNNGKFCINSSTTTSTPPSS